MRSALIVVSVLVVHVCVGFNTTGKYLRINNPFGGKRKEARIIHFDANKGEIEVELEFAVPFLSLPVKESVEMGKNLAAKVNTGAIILAGGLIFAISVLVPLISGLFSKKLHVNSEGNFRGNFYNSWFYLDKLEEILQNYNIDPTTCMQRIVCRNVKNASKRVNAGQGSSKDKLLDGIASSDYLMQYIQGSAIEEAIKNGYKGLKCSEEYEKCQLTHQKTLELTKYFINIFNALT